MKSATIIFVMLACALLLAGLALYMRGRPDLTTNLLRAEDYHTLNDQRARLTVIQGVMESWLSEEPGALIASMPNGGALFGTNLLGLMINAKNFDAYKGSLNMRRYLTDVWGNPIRIQFRKVATKDHQWEATIWSYGPNGRDDGGGGDDLVVERSF